MFCTITSKAKIRFWNFRAAVWKFFKKRWFQPLRQTVRCLAKLQIYFCQKWIHEFFCTFLRILEHCCDGNRQHFSDQYIWSKPLGWKIINLVKMLSVEILNRILLRFSNNVKIITNDIKVYMLCVALKNKNSIKWMIEFIILPPIFDFTLNFSKQDKYSKCKQTAALLGYQT